MDDNNAFNEIVEIQPEAIAVPNKGDEPNRLSSFMLGGQSEVDLGKQPAEGAADK